MIIFCLDLYKVLIMRAIKFLTVISILIFSSCSSDYSSQSLSNGTSLRNIKPILANQVQIGNQIWMTKNLNVSKYRNGDPIPQVQDPNQFTAMTTGAWCYYGNNPANGDLHGKLYNFYAVKDPRGLAPEGWHIASNQEWSILINFLGIEAKQKLCAPLMWPWGVSPITNSSGFSCLPSGGRFFDDESIDYYLGEESYIWTSTINTDYSAIYRYISTPNLIESPESLILSSGLSVRCVKN